MQKINNSAELKSAIKQAEIQQAADWILLNDQIMLVRDSLHPLQILKRSFNEIVSPADTKTTVLGSVMGLTAGVVSKALIVGSSYNPLKILFGALLQMKVSDTVTKNAGTIGFVATHLMGFLQKKKQKKTEIIDIPANPLKEIF